MKNGGCERKQDFKFVENKSLARSLELDRRVDILLLQAGFINVCVSMW